MIQIEESKKFGRWEFVVEGSTVWADDLGAVAFLALFYSKSPALPHGAPARTIKQAKFEYEIVDSLRSGKP
jgi:hypothetical protein